MVKGEFHVVEELVVGDLAEFVPCKGASEAPFLARR